MQSNNYFKARGNEKKRKSNWTRFIANDTQYGLTGGVYSRTPSHLEQARNQFNVGNL